MDKRLLRRTIGYGASILFTLAAFYIVLHPTLPLKTLSLFLLAIFQFITQSTCFLDLLGEKGPRWNLLVFLSTLSFVLVILLFTLWIMDHLNYRMTF
jgi:cytochrome o ubiquinol oxidase operon protein cyoD